MKLSQIIDKLLDYMNEEIWEAYVGQAIYKDSFSLEDFKESLENFPWAEESIEKAKEKLDDEGKLPAYKVADYVFIMGLLHVQKELEKKGL